MSQSVEPKRTEFKDTLNLPKTEFPIRPNAKVDDPALIERWEQEGLYAKAMACNEGKTTYILHDGPPYANGNIHLGHAYNKILKDIITKAHRMSGYHAPYTPGWDCHGLPIEIKVSQEQPGLDPLAFKKACRTYAQKWIDVQRSEFKRLGILMDWDHPYRTMDYSYEATIMRALGKLYQDGFIERKNKTVSWCPSCQTTLAAAEIEYEDRKDPSIYVLFPLAHIPDPRIAAVVGGAPVNLVVWTTTPWTLPLNRALAIKPGSVYQLIRIGDRLVIVGEKLAPALMALVPGDQEILANIPAESLVGLEARHPFIESLTVPILADELVSLDDGTAIVHKAPGCGPEDYEFGVKHNLEIYSPITADGRYTDQIVPKELAGMSVADGQGAVIKRLAEAGMLFHKASITHSYPHCWRCHNGLIFRATPQWFFDLQHEGIQEKALQAVETINFIPEAGRNFLRATLAHRWEWCLSRQKLWGVPIPALICTKCDTAITDEAFIEKVATHVAQEGVEYWERVPLAELIPAGLRCAQCKNSEFRKEKDILDVWFDAGLSHLAVLKPQKQFPADLYLEGIDQFRGWFQSSLLTSLVLEGEPPMRMIATHGFTVDEQGRKMSKSLGNVMPPQQLIDRLGTDGVRLWAASLGLEGDAVVSERVIQNVGEVYRKVRNTCRFLLQNLYDFSIERDGIAVTELQYLDTLMFLQCAQFNDKMRKAYMRADLTEVFHGLADFCTTQLSALYLDSIKDRLYVERADGKARRSAQTVVWYLLDTLTRLMAPICSCTAEQLTDLYQRSQQHESIHLQPFADLSPYVEEIHTLVSHDEQQWETMLLLRDAILKELERKREEGLIKHSLEAQVTIHFMTECPQCSTLASLKEQLERRDESIESFLQELCIVSKITFVESSQGLEQTSLAGVFAHVEHAAGTKCPRCWQWHETQHVDGLCDRCASIVTS